MSRSDSDSIFGAALRRREDPALVTGRAEYTDDLSVPGATHLALHRSQYAHARLASIDTARAEAMDGVVGVYTWDDVAASDAPGVLPTSPSIDSSIPGHPILARDRVRYQGEPIAAVVAEDRYAARDAAEAIEVEYDRLDAVTDPDGALGEDAPALFDAAPGNVAIETGLGDEAATDEAFDAADTVVELDLENNRLIPNAIEPRAAIADYDATTGRLEIDMSSQAVHRHRGKFAQSMGLPEGKIRVRAPHVGGGFGHKGHHHPGDALAAWTSIQLDRPVKWVATRSENYLAGAHGRDHRTHAELAIDRDGTIRGLRVDTCAAIGAYALGAAPRLVGRYGNLLSSQYAIPAIHCRTRGVFTTTAPVHSYRGAGRPEAIYVTERLVDLAAREVGMDPVELRRHNLIDADDFPYETPVGATYDSGDYERGLDVALEAADYDDLRQRREAAREEGRLYGVGVANYVESTGSGYHGGIVRVHASGDATVYVGTHSHGQGHETTYAQVVADELDIPYEDVEVVEGDTERVPAGSGTSGSRSAVTAGGALAEGARETAEKARRIAAHLLEAPEEDVEVERGEFSVRGAPERSVDFAAVADAAYSGDLPEGMERGLEATSYFAPEAEAYAFGTHVAAVEIDPDTGAIEVDRYLAHDDCGERINPRLIDGQVHGGVAQGVGQALLEKARYDGSGNLVTGSLQDYAIPGAFDVPEMETAHTVTPSPLNPLGVKGVGEAGTIATPPALVNAVVDALAPLGVEHLDMPLTDEAVWRAIQSAE